MDAPAGMTFSELKELAKITELAAIIKKVIKKLDYID